MTMQCTRTALDGERCPWAAVDGLTVCLHHLGQVVDQAAELIDQERAQRAENRRRAAEFKRENRRIAAMLQAGAAEAERKHAAYLAEAKQARKDAWHARRREQEAQRRADAAEARKTAHEAAQDPATRQACRVCGRSLPLEAFPRDRAALLGRMTRCRDCQRAYDRERRSKR